MYVKELYREIVIKQIRIRPQWQGTSKKMCRGSFEGIVAQASKQEQFILHDQFGDPDSLATRVAFVDSV